VGWGGVHIAGYDASWVNPLTLTPGLRASHQIVNPGCLTVSRVNPRRHAVSRGPVSRVVLVLPAFFLPYLIIEKTDTSTASTQSSRVRPNCITGNERRVLEVERESRIPRQRRPLHHVRGLVS